MMQPYEIFLRTEAIQALRLIRPAARKQLAEFIDSLPDNPFFEGDYAMRDPSGRALQIKVIGAYAVTYWSDHAVKEIKVIDIRAADGA